MEKNGNASENWTDYYTYVSPKIQRVIVRLTSSAECIWERNDGVCMYSLTKRFDDFTFKLYF